MTYGKHIWRVAAVVAVAVAAAALTGSASAAGRDYFSGDGTCASNGWCHWSEVCYDEFGGCYFDFWCPQGATLPGQCVYYGDFVPYTAASSASGPGVDDGNTSAASSASGPGVSEENDSAGTSLNGTGTSSSTSAVAGADTGSASTSSASDAITSSFTIGSTAGSVAGSDDVVDSGAGFDINNVTTGDILTGGPSMTVSEGSGHAGRVQIQVHQRLTDLRTGLLQNGWYFLLNPFTVHL